MGRENELQFYFSTSRMCGMPDGTHLRFKLNSLNLLIFNFIQDWQTQFIKQKKVKTKDDFRRQFPIQLLGVGFNFR
jgi:hypothetical protein